MNKKENVIYDLDITAKVCHICGEEKPIDQFSKVKVSKDGHDSVCKICKNESQRLRRELRRGNMTEDDKLKQREADRKYRANNKDRINATNKRYYDKNSKTINEKGKKFNKYEHRRDYFLKYRKKQREDNPCVKLHYNLRCLIHCAMKRGGYVKESRTEEILGCTIEEFKAYLESKFEPWMNWDNYGKYNGQPNYGFDIDHIIPISTAKTEEDVIRLNHYTNLQPLCSHINRDVKRDKVLS